VRFRFALALMVAGMLFAAGIASAQSTTTEPLSGYTNTTPTETQAATTEETQTTAPEAQADEEDSVAPTVAAQTTASAPDSLAFTGGEPLLLIILGLALTGGTVALLVRERRRGES
jgi:carbohydrate-binding DOMON domain-containing protein